MIGIGIIGFGFMGRTHFQAYAADDRAEVLAIADANPEGVRAASTAGNIAGGGVDPAMLDDVAVHARAEDLLADDSIDAVSICVPTPFHPEIAIAALQRGKHVLVEKPLALNETQAQRVASEAADHPELICLPAMCMRFWPGWSWLKDVIHDHRFGRVRAARFTRLGAAPDWGGGFYRDPALNGGAILDLHIHDADFVRFCFGDPDAVTATGSRGPTGGLDHVMTNYHFADGPEIVTAEGGWMSVPAFPFTMRYEVNFEKATAVFDAGADSPLTVYTEDGGTTPIQLEDDTGYAREIAHFLDCIENGRGSDLITLDDGVEAVRLIDRERISATTSTRTEL